MDILLFYYNDVQHSLDMFNSFLSTRRLQQRKLTPPKLLRSQAMVTMATITPALTTTQLLISNTQPCMLPQKTIDLSMLLRNNSKIPSLGSGPLTPINPSKKVQEKKDPPAAQQPKRPAWTETHAYLRGTRINGDTLRILSTEVNMISALKITRSLKPRRAYKPRREDEFIWGNPSPLRTSFEAKGLTIQTNKP